MSEKKRSVLITGCSDGGLGAALAVAFHNAGLHVYATARNPSKMEDLANRGIETLTLDVQSEESIKACVDKIPSLDILINNAGGQYLMPVADIDIAEAKKLFDLNVWSYIAVAQAFMPLLMKSSNAMIVNQTSIAAVVTIPFQPVYNASKAAISVFTDNLRLELQPFDIKVVDLKTGLIKSNMIDNLRAARPNTLPEGSIYGPAKEQLEKSLRQDHFEGGGMPADQWAQLVVQDLMRANPPPQIWRGESVWLTRLATIMPFGLFDNMLKKVSGLDVVERIIKKKSY